MIRSFFCFFKKTYGYCIFPLIFLSACNKTEDFAIDYKYGYFPHQQGFYTVYDVDSVAFNEFIGEPDTFRYQKKEVIDSAFTDNAGRPAFKILRYQRSDSTEQWRIADVWYGVVTQNSAERVEENLRFVKMIFPPEENLTWDGNRHVQIVDALWWLQDWEYKIASLDVPETINGIHFDSTLTVHQRDWQIAIKKVYALEKYAKNVGLIYKEIQALEKQDVTAPWTQPDNGFTLKMSIREYGNQ